MLDNRAVGSPLASSPDYVLLGEALGLGQRRGGAGVGDWTADHQDPGQGGAWVNTDGFTFADYQTVYSDPSSLAAFQQGAQITGLESGFSSGNQGQIVAAGGMTDQQASSYAASRGYGATSTSSSTSPSSIFSAISPALSSLFSGAGTVAAAVVPKLVGGSSPQAGSIFGNLFGSHPAAAPAPSALPSWLLPAGLALAAVAVLLPMLRKG